MKQEEQEKHATFLSIHFVYSWEDSLRPHAVRHLVENACPCRLERWLFSVCSFTLLRTAFIVDWIHMLKCTPIVWGIRELKNILRLPLQHNSLHNCDSMLMYVSWKTAHMVGCLWWPLTVKATEKLCVKLYFAGKCVFLKLTFESLIMLQEWFEKFLWTFWYFYLLSENLSQWEFIVICMNSIWPQPLFCEDPNYQF